MSNSEKNTSAPKTKTGKETIEVNAEQAFTLGVAQKRFRNNYIKKQRRRKALSFIFWSLLSIITVLTIFLLSFSVSFSYDNSMENTITDNQLVVSNRLAYTMKSPSRGDLVTLRLADANGNVETMQRRIIGLPGDEIEIIDGIIYINGQQCIEDYVATTTSSAINKVNVPTNTYYVLCDNRDAGPDSRDGLYVLMDSVIGDVVYNTDLPSWIQKSHLTDVFKFLNRYL